MSDDQRIPSSDDIIRNMIDAGISPYDAEKYYESMVSGTYIGPVGVRNVICAGLDDDADQNVLLAAAVNLGMRRCEALKLLRREAGKRGVSVNITMQPRGRKNITSQILPQIEQDCKAGHKIGKDRIQELILASYPGMSGPSLRRNVLNIRSHISFAQRCLSE